MVTTQPPSLSAIVSSRRIPDSGSPGGGLVGDVFDDEPAAALELRDLAENRRLRHAARVGKPDRPVAAGAQSDESAFAEPREELGHARERVEGVGRGGVNGDGADDGETHAPILTPVRRSQSRGLALILRGPCSAPLREALASAVAAAAREKLGAEIAAERIVLERPPKLAMGDFASPVAFDLAKTLRKAPRAIAAELAAAVILPAGVREARVEGGGYLNFFLDRGPLVRALLAGVAAPAPRPGKVIVEHTNINPNKAAHIGHLRNAVLGDVLVRVAAAVWAMPSRSRTISTTRGSRSPTSSRA